MLKRITSGPAIVAGFAVLAVTAGGSAAFALSSAPAASPAATAGAKYECVKLGDPANHYYEVNGILPHACAPGFVIVGTGPAGAQGAQGPAGLAGAKGDTGPAGPQGPAGSNGSDALLTVSAVTSVTAWPESGGWATDDFTRTVQLTRQHAAATSHCGGAAHCWYYTETLADNGTFTTVAGHASPNGSSSATIHGTDQGTIVGGGSLEFYASSDVPNPSLVPATATGAAKPSSTTDWYKLFFPGGTAFGLASGGSAPWTTYNWVYTATSPNTCEKWTDGINPGDDGQGAGDGNLTGVSACSG